MSEKYLKRLIGNSDIEDALKRLDKLTNEEDRMVSAQVLEVTHTVGDNVLGVDNKVAHVNDRVTDIGDNVTAIADKVAAVLDGV